MKKLFLILLVFGLNKAIASVNSKIDSVYYLIDTTKTAFNDRMRDIHEEYPSYKVYAIKCPCLRYDGEPSF